MPGTGRSGSDNLVPVLRAILWGLVAICAAFSIAILFLPLGLYRMLGHTLEAGTALFCMLCCLYAYRAVAARRILLLTAFAFGSYALSTIFWYLYSVALGREHVFLSVAELGFFGFTFFLIAGMIIGFPRRAVPWHSRALPAAALLALAGAVVVMLPPAPASALLVIRLLTVGILLDTVITRGVREHALLCLGILLRALSALLYGFREAVLIAHPGWAVTIPVTGGTMPLYDVFSLVGPLMVFSFLAIQLGLFSWLETLQRDAAATH